MERRGDGVWRRESAGGREEQYHLLLPSHTHSCVATTLTIWLPWLLSPPHQCIHNTTLSSSSLHYVLAREGSWTLVHMPLFMTGMRPGVSTIWTSNVVIYGLQTYKLNSILYYKHFIKRSARQSHNQLKEIAQLASKGYVDCCIL